MDEQDTVANFLERNDLETPPAYRLLDLASELGEVAKEVLESTDYGESPDDITVAEDEVGDALFSLLALSSALEVDASEALETALAKYERRLDDAGTPASGE